MKDIKKFLEKPCLEVLCRNNFYWEQALDFFDNDVPSKYVDLYKKYELLSNEFIYENLQTHDAEKLKEKLKKEYNDLIGFHDYNGESKKSFYIILSDYANINEFAKKYAKTENEFEHVDKFENILSFFNYYISFIEYQNNAWTLFVEPRYSDEISRQIYDEHLYLYHFTDKESAKSILENGLRCKKSSYRYYPERIFLYATKKKININNEDTKEFIDKVINHSKVKKYGLSILRIRNDGTYRIYNDTAMKDDNAVFIYENIPAEYIKEINI